MWMCVHEVVFKLKLNFKTVLEVLELVKKKKKKIVLLACIMYQPMTRNKTDLYIEYLSHIQETLMRNIKNHTVLPTYLPKKCINIINSYLLVEP